jgi:hypothetical protein
MVCNKLFSTRVVLCTRLRVSFNAYVDPLFEIPSDLPGVNPTTNDGMILYYCLMTKVDGLLCDSTVFSWAGCHSRDRGAPPLPQTLVPIPLLSRAASQSQTRSRLSLSSPATPLLCVSPLRSTSSSTRPLFGGITGRSSVSLSCRLSISGPLALPLRL